MARSKHWMARCNALGQALGRRLVWLRRRPGLQAPRCAGVGGLQRAGAARQLEAAQPGDGSLGDKWWQLFGDAQLDALEEKINVSNQTLKTATGQYFAARDQIRVARAAYFPTLGVGASVSRIRLSKNQPNTLLGTTKFDYNLLALQGQAQWEPDLWGQVRRTVEQARADAQASAADLANVALSLHAELALDYFLLRGLDTQKQLLDTTLASDADELQLARVRFKGGVANAVDVAQAETQYLQVKARGSTSGCSEPSSSTPSPR